MFFFILDFLVCILKYKNINEFAQMQEKIGEVVFLHIYKKRDATIASLYKKSY